MQLPCNYQIKYPILAAGTLSIVPNLKQQAEIFGEKHI